MAKIALITDTHWGIRGDTPAFYDYFKKSLHEFFFPILREKGIKHIVHLGDVVDRRKYINFLTAHRIRKDFFEPVEKEFTMDIIIGNHDTFFKNTNEVNSIDELVQGKYKNIRIFAEPREIEVVPGTTILYVPWICKDNYERTIELVKATRAMTCFGHLELSGFEMYRGSISEEGFDRNLFSNFNLVCSGHYHHRSSYDNITYLGAFCEYTWQDYGDDRGFNIFDTETGTLEFVKNPFGIFKKVFYDDQNKTFEDIINIKTDIKDTIVKVIIKNKNNHHWFDLFIDKLEGMGPIELQVVEDHLNLNMESDSDIISGAEDTITIFKNYVSQLDVGTDKKNKMEKVLVDLYYSALDMGSSE